MNLSQSSRISQNPTHGNSTAKVSANGHETARTKHSRPNGVQCVSESSSLNRAGRNALPDGRNTHEEDCGFRLRTLHIRAVSALFVGVHLRLV